MRVQSPQPKRDCWWRGANIILRAPRPLRARQVCKSAFYCDAVCQRKDWEEGGHRLVCKRPKWDCSIHDCNRAGDLYREYSAAPY